MVSLRNQIAMSTHPIGKNTVNRTANLPAGIDRRFSHLAAALGVSKSDLIRRLVNGLVKGSIHTAQLGKSDTDMVRTVRTVRTARTARGRRNSPLDFSL